MEGTGRTGMQGELATDKVCLHGPKHVVAMATFCELLLTDVRMLVFIEGSSGAQDGI